MNGNPDRGVALVTGAARSHGGRVAARLAEDGYVVAVADVRDCSATVERIAANGGTAVPFECDIRDWDAVLALVDRVEADVGPITALAQVVGVWETVPFLELTPASWRRLLDVNLDGTFHVCRAVAAPMAERRAGAIVCISSNAAYMAWHGGAHYTTSKAAINGLVKAMAFELGPFGIRVNAVCPGTIRSDSTAEELADPATLAEQVEACPLGRVGEPDDVAEAVSFLCDARRAAWITGEALLVDGGFGTHGVGANFGGSINSLA